MFELIEKLISKVIDLIKEHKRRQRELFEEFIMPLMSQFEHLHNNYVATFKTYIDLVANSPDELNKDHPVFAQISRDKIFSSDLRYKALSMWQVLRQEFSDLYDDEDKFLRFLRALAEYLTYLGSPAHDMERNRPRGSLLEVLSRIANSGEQTQKKKIVAENEILEKLKEMQRFYASVDREFQALKYDLLK